MRIVPFLILLILGACSTPTAPEARLGFGEERIFEAHREVDVRFVSGDSAVMEGTLYLPRSSGSYPAVVFHFGSGRWTRAPYQGTGIPRWVEQGIAVLSYDKRGVGESDGQCCPWNTPNYFSLLAGDVLAAVHALQTHPEIKPREIGLWGFSQGGWVVPIAASRAPDDIAFAMIGSGPAVTLKEELLYSLLTGDQECQPTGLSDEEIWRMIESGELETQFQSYGVEGVGFDPRPFLEEMQMPSLWLYGGKDTSVPVERSVANLEHLRETLGKDITVLLFPSANHELIEDGNMCQREGRFVDGLTPTFAWLRSYLSLGEGGVIAPQAAE